jgi:hypothetical protein
LSHASRDKILEQGAAADGPKPAAPERAVMRSSQLAMTAGGLEAEMLDFGQWHTGFGSPHRQRIILISFQPGNRGSYSMP